MKENKLVELSMDFAIKIIKLCETIKGHYSLVNQLERSATSIGANIHEANYAVVVAKLGNPKKAESMIQEAEARGYKNGPEIRKMAGIEKKSFFSRLGSAFRG